MIYHDIPSNENIPSYHIPIVISIYPINICIYIWISHYVHSHPLYTHYISIFLEREAWAPTRTVSCAWWSRTASPTLRCSNVSTRCAGVRWQSHGRSHPQTWDFSAATGGFYLQLIIQRCMNQKIVCQIWVKAFDCCWIFEPRPGYRNVSKPTPLLISLLSPLLSHVVHGWTPLKHTFSWLNPIKIAVFMLTSH